MSTETPSSAPSLAAVVCTAGRATLGRALASLDAQSDPPAEILVVDNSPIDSRTRALARQHPGVRYVQEPTPGLDFARNRALAEARSEVVAFLDDDAVAHPGWAAALAARFADPRVGAVTGQVGPLHLQAEGEILFEANGGYGRGQAPIRLPHDAGRPLPLFGEPGRPGHAAPLIAWAVSVGSGCSLAVRRPLALALGGFDEALDLGAALPGGGDHDMLWRLLGAGHDVVYEPRALAWHEHRRDPEAVSRQLAGHQRALIALLVKSLWTARGRERLPIAAFLGWRLVKPAVRLARRLVGRDPLPFPALLRMAWSCWRGLGAYPAARGLARRRRDLGRTV
jgi:glycosyltransferase involved in cell wall biosynthesis